MNVQKKPCRIVFLGSGKVGKTCLIHRFLKMQIAEKYHPTIEDIYSRDIEKSDEKIQLKIEILDTSGSFNFAGMLALSISQATAFVLVCSVDDDFSIEQVKNLLSQIQSQRDDFDLIPICITCNKTDMKALYSKDIEKLISSLQSDLHVESNQIVLTSAKLDENVLEIFHSLWNQNIFKKAFPIARPKETSHWSILIKRRVSALESMTNNNCGNITNSSKPGEMNSMFRTKSLCQSSSSNSKEIQKLKLHSKSFFKRSITTSTPKEWKTGDVLKLDCIIS